MSLLIAKKQPKNATVIARHGDSYIYLVDGIKKADRVTELSFDEDGPKVEPLPVIYANQRNALFISGPSGSGKSTYAANFIKELQKLKKYKKQNVYIFTGQVKDDPAFNGIKNLFKVLVDQPTLFDMTFDLFEDCIVIFDDYEAINNPAVKRHILNLQKQLLQLGRKQNTTVLTINHETQNHHDTKVVITESETYVLFPGFGFPRVEKFLKAYMGFGKKEIQEIKELETRALTVRKVVPLFWISDYKVKLI